MKKATITFNDRRESLVNTLPGKTFTDKVNYIIDKGLNEIAFEPKTLKELKTQQGQQLIVDKAKASLLTFDTLTANFYDLKERYECINNCLVYHYANYYKYYYAKLLLDKYNVKYTNVCDEEQYIFQLHSKDFGRLQLLNKGNG